MDRVGWAVVCCAWVEGVLIGESLREERGDGLWDPERQTHRGRASLGNEDEVAVAGLNVALQVMPTKMGQGNRKQVRKQMRKVFKVLEHGEELSAGWERIVMVREDLVGGDPRLVPLFRPPETRAEISKRCFGRWSKEALVRVGLGELATGVHEFRIGGCTAMTDLAGLDASVEPIGWAKTRMGKRYASDGSTEDPAVGQDGAK